MPKPLPYRDGELLVAKMEEARDEGNLDFVEANMPRLEDLIARIQDEQYRLAQTEGGGILAFYAWPRVTVGVALRWGSSVDTHNRPRVKGDFAPAVPGQAVPGKGYLTPPPMAFRSRLLRPQRAAKQGRRMVEQRRGVPGIIALISLCRSASRRAPTATWRVRSKERGEDDGPNGLVAPVFGSASRRTRCPSRIHSSRPPGLSPRVK